MDSLLERDCLPNNEMARNFSPDEITRFEKRMREIAREESKPPSVWGKFMVWVRAQGSPIALVAVFVAMLGITLGAVYQSYAHVREETKFQTKTEGRLEAIESRLGNIESSLLSLRALQAAATPTDQRSQSEAKEILASAKRGATPLPVNIIAQAGKSFIQASQMDPNAWDTALSFINYRSSVNEVMSRPVALSKIPKSPSFSMAAPHGKAPPTIRSYGIGVPITDAVILEEIGENKNAGMKVGLDRLFFDGGAVALDGHHLRHIVMKGVEVHYFGAPVILEDVVFINCTFVIHNNQPGRRFGETFLASASAMDFKAKG